MKTYGQRCALAKTLDVLGDRWTMLIVRELSLRTCRYGDLRANLPGIASNLLAQRLRDLEVAGVIEKRNARPPVATSVYALTAHGDALVPTLDALTRWGYSMLSDAPPTDEFRLAWIGALIRAFLRDVPSGKVPEMAVGFAIGDESAVMKINSNGSVELLNVDSADVRVRGEINAVWPYLTHRHLSRPELVTIEGDAKRLDQLRALLADAVEAVG